MLERRSYLGATAVTQPTPWTLQLRRVAIT